MVYQLKLINSYSLWAGTITPDIKNLSGPKPGLLPSNIRYNQNIGSFGSAKPAQIYGVKLDIIRFIW
jgi:hypothetical protein